RGPLNFSDELLQAAEKGAEKIQNLADKLNEQLSKSAEGEKVDFNFEQWYKKFEEAMDDDFNSAQATAVLFDFTREVNRVIAENENPDKEFYSEAKSFLKKTAEDVLGIVNFETKESLPSLENDLIELLIKIRAEAKQNKNYALSDKIRDELNKLGVILQDTKDGTSYKKVKK
uniref:DALR domain-containing protein n=2 Tax=Ignavibacterium TaxID=795750 RepID=UPI00345AED19